VLGGWAFSHGRGTPVHIRAGAFDLTFSRSTPSLSLLSQTALRPEVLTYDAQSQHVDAAESGQPPPARAVNLSKSTPALEGSTAARPGEARRPLLEPFASLAVLSPDGWARLGRLDLAAGSFPPAADIMVQFKTVK